MDWLDLLAVQGTFKSPLFNLYADYIMRNAGLEEAQAGVKIAGRNINNLRYADDTTLMAESEEELKRLLMKVKEESEKDGLKLNIQNTKIMASGPITSWEMGKQWKQCQTLFFGGLQNQLSTVVQVDQVLDFSLRVINIHHSFIYSLAKTTLLTH